MDTIMNAEILPFTESSYPGFYLIEGYSRHAISKDGVIISLLTGEPVKIKLDKSARWIVSIWDDRVGDVTQVRRYRLMMIALSDRPANYRELTVNHIDTNTLNDSLDNLEWMTAIDNIKAAQRDGHYDKHGPSLTPVEVKVIATDEVIRFNTLIAAQDFMGVSRDVVKTALNDKSQPSIKGLYLIRYVSEVEGDNRLNAVMRCGMLVNNLTLKKVERWPSLMSYVRDQKVPKNLVKEWLISGKPVAIRGEIYTFNPTIAPWRHVVEPEKELLAHGHSAAVILRDVVSGIDTEYQSITELAKANGWGVSTVSIWLSEPGQPLKLKRYQVKFKIDDTPWREISDLVSEQRGSGCGKMVRVTEPDGTIRDFMSAKTASDHYGILPTTANWRLKTAGGKVYPDGTRWEYL